eukprot:TRINITY_DN17367_c0_g1_i1.p1 TRINITY_DN17367_c0_g1~~TRINITY_DN17367_c0_g1_i1.p1  ORF type:complete len:271 (-),score=45.66 TRINITY_DN17367_c0_g1_i1:60-812(-)
MCIRDRNEYVLKFGRIDQKPNAEQLELLQKEIEIQNTLHLTSSECFAQFIGKTKLEVGGTFREAFIERYETASLSEVIKNRRNSIDEAELWKGFNDPIGRVPVMPAQFTSSEIYGFLVNIVTILDTFDKTGIFHLDIKPDNILVDSETWSKLKMTDFGSANKLKDYTSDQVVEVGDRQFSRNYSAPERLESIKEFRAQKIEKTKYDPMKSEIFSFGKTLKEVLEVADPPAKALFEEIVNQMMHNLSLIHI